MGDEENKSPGVSPYVLVALCCAGASIVIVVAALLILRVITDVGMCAIAVMAMAPAMLGTGIAFFMSRQPPKA